MEDLPRFERNFRERLANHDYHAIFMRGCCYHFALKLNEIRRLDLAYIYSTSSENGVDHPIGHCWARCNQNAVDINGVLPEQVIRAIYDGGRGEALPIEPEKLRASLDSRKIPDLLNQEIFNLAAWVIEKHARFDGAFRQEEVLSSLFKNEDASSSP